MNESLEDKKIKIGKGKVTLSGSGQPETFVNLIKANINRKDPMSDKLLYIVENIKLSDGLYAVTPKVSVAVGWVEASDIGIMREDGELLAPMIYSDIKVINERFIACNTASSSQEVETKKDELTKVQENAQISQDIKASMKEEVGEELNFVCDDFYAKYDVYEVEDKKDFKRVFADASFIALNKDTLYVHTNNKEDETISFGKEKVQTNVEKKTLRTPIIINDEQVHLPQDDIPGKKLEMPVEPFATLDGKVLDSLGDTSKLEPIKPGAPALINEEETEEEIKTDENTIKTISPSSVEINNTEKEVEENKTEEPKPETIKPEKTEIEENKVETTKPIEQEEIKTVPEIVSSIKTDIPVSKPKQEEIKTVPEIVSSIKTDIPVSKPKQEEIRRPSGNMPDIAAIISAVQGKINHQEDAIEEKDKELEKQQNEIDKQELELKKKQDELLDKEREIDSLRNRIEQLTKVKDTQASTIEILTDKNKLQAEKMGILQTENVNLRSENDSLHNTIDQVTTAFSGFLNEEEEISNEHSLRRVA